MAWRADGIVAMVEDSDEDFRAFERVFRRHASITRWRSGEDAMRRLTAAEDALERVAMVFVDMNLPDMGGAVVIRRIRELPGGDDTTVIAYSGSALQQDIQAALDAGVDNYEIKPRDAAGLREVAKRASEIRAAKRRARRRPAPPSRPADRARPSP